MKMPSLAECVRFSHEGDYLIQRVKRDIKSAIFRGQDATVRRLRRRLAALYRRSFRRAVDYYFRVHYRGRRPAWARRLVPTDLKSQEYYQRLWHYMRMHGED